MFESPRGKWFFTFSLFAASLLSLSTLAFADSGDPFDPASCSGSGISVERELELLGSNTSRNLPVATPHHRWRNVIDGVDSGWYQDSGGESLWVQFENHDGQFQVTVERQIQIQRRYTDDNDEYTTSNENLFNCNPRSGTDECVTSNDDESPYRVSLTDNCIRILHEEPQNGVQSETVYMWNL